MILGHTLLLKSDFNVQQTSLIDGFVEHSSLTYLTVQNVSKSYLLNLWIWSHLKLRLSKNFCSKTWPQFLNKADLNGTQWVTKIDFDFGQINVLLKSDLDI